LFFRGSVESTDDGRALIFASDEQLELLSASKNVYMDGTFKTVPSLYYQLYTIFVKVDHYTFPVFYSLTTKKSFLMYTAILSKLRDIAPSFAPLSVMADFEEASVSSFTHVFGAHVTVHGCWFHYSQAVMKYARKLGLAQAYKDDANARNCLRSLTCLPLLPADDIQGRSVNVIC